ncbi:MAG: protein-methionine-sulfoxide reductase catalytic subunit MsrP [Gammaproteobacteria bacterium]|nr:protein-methionine-sulfoxide reductase catalytic subunit MsrP [Gammaproteobacteria bacterium]
MLIKRADPIKPSEITSEAVYFNRRRFVQSAVAAGTLMLSGVACSKETATNTAYAGPGAGAASAPDSSSASFVADALGKLQPSKYSTREKVNSWEDVTTYNNFYEFGLDKSDPARNAQDLKTQPWSIDVSGEADNTGRFYLEDFISPHTLEERIYRLRCVEAWSMVIPWAGIELGQLIKRFQPTSKARYVEFKTLYDPDQMPGQRRRSLNWPYTEGLTMAEAMHPLTILAVGVFGKVLPNQNGAPLRLVVPWKYGFKSIKSIVSMKFTEKMPANSWAVAQPREYGFYANVNPQVDHPRWSQARERPIGEGLFAKKIPTRMFNGYADEVAHLYDGLDLVKNF